MKISEIFHSIQGEGKLAGVPSVFVRTSGCNLRCTWCDTPYTSWEAVGESRSIGEIVEQVKAYDTKHVVLTGGEPMVAADVGELTGLLMDAGHHLTIETAATVWQDVTCDLASISPKLSNSNPRDREGGRFADSHESTRINVEVIRRFMQMPDHQLKFVVDRAEDMDEIDDVLAQIGGCAPSDVLLMPQGITQNELDARGPWVATLCKQRGFRFCPRLHIGLYGDTRGT